MKERDQDFFFSLLERLVLASESRVELGRERNRLLEESVSLQRDSLKLQYEQATLFTGALREDAGKITEVEKP